MEFHFRKTVSLHVWNCTKKDGVFLWIDFVNTIFFGSFHSSIRSGVFYKIGLLNNFGKLTGKYLSHSFFLEKVAHHQTCNFIIITVNFAQLLKAICRTCPVSASNFNSTFLTVRPRETYTVSTFSQHYFFWCF